MTKVFGIGLQRTGTTSLHQAGLLLGLRAAPMSVAFLDNLHAPTLQQFDLFSDNPIPQLYPQLDLAYPNSKFILTTRPVEAWLTSVHWLFTQEVPKLPPALRTTADEVHQQLYDRTTFDAQHFRAFWHAYHTNVDAYFAQRPADLLRLDFSAGDGWEKLCPFLGVPIPDTPFPHANKRRQKRWWKSY